MFLSFTNPSKCTTVVESYTKLNKVGINLLQNPQVAHAFRQPEAMCQFVDNIELFLAFSPVIWAICLLQIFAIKTRYPAVYSREIQDGLTGQYASSST